MTRMHVLQGNESLIARQPLNSVRLIKIYTLGEKRNQWINWDGETGIVRSNSGIRLFLDEAADSVETMRTSGSQFVIEEAPAIYFMGSYAGLIVADFGPTRAKPFGDFHFSKRWAACRQMTDLAHLLSTTTKKSLRKYVLTGDLSLPETYVFGEALFVRNSQTSGGRSKLGWALSQRKVDARAVSNFVAEFSRLAKTVNPAGTHEEAPIQAASLKVAELQHGGQLPYRINVNIDTNERALHQSSLEQTTTEREQLEKARVGQGLFRTRLEAIEAKCRVTQVSALEHLIASHIKPWRLSNDFERLDGNNGLLLSPHVDHLFDKGYISFTDEGDLLVSDSVNEQVLASWSIPKVLNVGNFNNQQRPYLCFHREVIFHEGKSSAWRRESARS